MGSRSRMMCVILVREPNVSFPQDKLETACDINKDGFGLSFIDKGKKGPKIVTIRSLDKNDFKSINKELEKVKDRRVFLHLRHSTVGEVNLQNSHPFFPMEEKDGLPVGFMHNGTIWAYKPATGSTDSDSFLFQLGFLKPLLLRTAAFHAFKGEQTLSDWFLGRTIEKELGHGESVIILFDVHGNWKSFGKKGKDYEGFWASNDYSFDDQFWRSSKKTTKPPSSAWDCYGAASPFVGDDDNLPFPHWQGTGNFDIQWDSFAEEINKIERETTVSEAWTKHVEGQVKRIGEYINTTRRGSLSVVNPAGNFIALDVKRTPFVKLAGIGSLNDLTKLTPSNLEELCEKYPRGMAEVLIDLLAERMRHGLGEKKIEAEIIKDTGV
jgi:predicted glutamine amidotransferase